MSPLPPSFDLAAPMRRRPSGPARAPRLVWSNPQLGPRGCRVGRMSAPNLRLIATIL